MGGRYKRGSNEGAEYKGDGAGSREMEREMTRGEGGRRQKRLEGEKDQSRSV